MAASHCDQQLAYPVFYRGEKIDEYIPDLEVEKRVIVDAKAIERITDVERGQGSGRMWKRFPGATCLALPGLISQTT